MLNAQTRKEFDLRLDEIEKALDSDDTYYRMAGVVGFATLLRELEPAIAACEFMSEPNFDFGQRVMAIHNRIM